MCQVPGSASTLQFAGQTISGSSVMLLTVDVNASSITVNTEKIVLGNYLSIIASSIHCKDLSLPLSISFLQDQCYSRRSRRLLKRSEFMISWLPLRRCVSSTWEFSFLISKCMFDHPCDLVMGFKWIYVVWSWIIHFYRVCFHCWVFKRNEGPQLLKVCCFVSLLIFTKLKYRRQL